METLFDDVNICFFKFQKKKINEELEHIEEELFKQYEKIGEEVNIKNKLKVLFLIIMTLQKLMMTHYLAIMIY